MLIPVYRIQSLTPLEIAQRLASFRARFEIEGEITISKAETNAGMLLREIAQALELNDAEQLIVLGPEASGHLEVVLA